MPTGELIRWYKTAINNLYTDCAEEEYLRYKFCLANRMPLVMEASIHNPVHYDPIKNVGDMNNAIPTPACEALMGMVHDSHRYFTKVIDTDCGHYFQPFFDALVSNRDLNDALIKYEKIQRCAIGREIRARVQTDTPTFAGAWQIFGRIFLVPLLPKMFINWVEIRSNPVVEYKERDCDVIPIFDGVNVPNMKPLIDELRTELVLEGKLAPEPLRSYQTPFQHIPTQQTPKTALSAFALAAQPHQTTALAQHNQAFHQQNMEQLFASAPPSDSYVTLPPHMRDE
jgi:hypothetical protein